MLMRAERVLITGAGGFLGSHIAHYFGSLGHTVAPVGRFAATQASALSYPNLWKLCGMTLPDEAFRTIVSAFRPTLMVHCAGTASVADSVQQPYLDFQKTVEVCAFALETMRTLAPSCRVVLLSSASVYGNPAALPIEEGAPLRPVSPYGYHKMLSETLAEEYRVLHGMKVAVIRIFSAYGERLRRQVVHDICHKFANPAAETIELFGTGNESRDFIHALDVARGIDCIHRNDAVGTFNVASGVQTSISDLAGIIGGLFANAKPVVFTGEIRQGDPLNWQASIDSIAALGFRQGLGLEAGLARYIAWYKTAGNNEVTL